MMVHAKSCSGINSSDEALLDAYVPIQRRKPFHWKDIVLVVLATALIGLSLLILRQRGPSHNTISRYAGLESSTERWVEYQWFSKYSRGDNEADINDVWSEITPAHGIVALDNSWAAERRLPTTMRLPSDHSKGVYVIDAYHQLHCLTIVRKTFFELAAGKSPTYPPAHSTHCFDSLRQYVMCTAGDTPLYTWGRNITGDGQLRKCQDWRALSKWAAENSACYKDSEKPIPLGDHFGHCEGNGDGLEAPF